MSFRTDLLRIWKDPVGSNVIAVVVLAGAGVLLSVFRQYWLPLGQAHPWISFGVACAVAAVASCALLLRYLRPTPRILVFLSKGGTCRDPMAKAIMDKLLETRKLKHPINVRAAGVGELSEKAASYAARYVIKEMYGEDLLANHTPEHFTAKLADEADLILVMDKSLINEKTMPPAKTHLLKKFFGLDGDVVDPWPSGKDANTLERYRKCANELREILTQNPDHLVQVLDL